MHAAALLLLVSLLPQPKIDARLELATRGNAQRMAALERLFRDAGCTPTRQAVPGSEAANVLCTLKGETDRVIILGAHFDMTGPGLGVADNWGSASLLASVYEALAKAKRKHTFVFIGFTDEELGLVGAKHYVNALTDAQRKNIAAMVNMDGVGMAQPRVWEARADARLLRMLHETAKKEELTVVESSLEGSGIMDSFVFHAKGIPSLSLHGLAPGNYGIPHSERDHLGAVDRKALYDSYRLVVRYLEALDATSGR